MGRVKPEHDQESRLREILGTAYNTMETKDGRDAIMAEGLSHSNVQFNSSVSYLFIEDGPGYKGRRLTLTKVSEEIDPDKIAAVRRHSPTCDWHDEGPRYLVYFHVDGERPLV